MYIFKNAFFNLGRNKGRNILMAVIFFVILFAVSVSIVVNSSTTQLIDRQKATFGAPVTLVRDYRKMPKQTTSSLPTAEEMMNYADSNLLMRAQLFTNLMATINGKSVSGGKTMDGAVQDGNGAPVDLLASSRKDISDEFSTGKRKIVSGDFINGAGQSLVSKDLAELNGWSVGDSITVNVAGNTGEASMKLKIVGIYEDHTAVDKSSRSSRRNEIFMDFKELVASDVYQVSRSITQAQFVLKNPADLAAFTKELHDKGLPEYYNVNVDDSAYDKIVGPLEGLKSITLTLTIVVTIFGAAVLLILAILSIRERKYEVGVLRAMGVKKGKVSLGLLTETLLITAVCLVLAVGSASVLSKPIGNALLQTQATSQSGGAQNNTNEQGDKVLNVEGGFKNITADEADLPVLEPKLTSEAAAQIALIALLLACAASAVSVVFVTRFEPMKILSERN